MVLGTEQGKELSERWEPTISRNRCKGERLEAVEASSGVFEEREIFGREGWREHPTKLHN